MIVGLTSWEKSVIIQGSKILTPSRAGILQTLRILLITVMHTDTVDILWNILLTLFLPFFWMLFASTLLWLYQISVFGICMIQLPIGFLSIADQPILLQLAAPRKSRWEDCKSSSKSTSKQVRGLQIWFQVHFKITSENRLKGVS